MEGNFPSIYIHIYTYEVREGKFRKSDTRKMNLSRSGTRMIKRFSLCLHYVAENKLRIPGGVVNWEGGLKRKSFSSTFLKLGFFCRQNYGRFVFGEWLCYIVQQSNVKVFSEKIIVRSNKFNFVTSNTLIVCMCVPLCS